MRSNALGIKKAERRCSDMIKGQKWRGTGVEYWFTCPIHGKYLQTYDNHYQGAGCSSCSKSKPRFNIREAKRRCPDLVKGQLWTGTRDRYYFLCSKHGKYLQLWHLHTSGTICPKCAIERSTLSLSDWQSRYPKATITGVKRVKGAAYLLVSCPSRKPLGCSGTRWVIAQNVKRTKGVCGHCSLSKGGYTNPQGYHILSIKGKKKVPQHRLIMEQIMKRTLFKNEEVHHKNGVRSDNRPKNLELRLVGHGPGQSLLERVQDIEHTCGIKIRDLIPARFKKIWG